MKVLAAFGLLMVPLALAQNLTGLPTCAQTCALNAISGSGCPLTNTTCICESATFISSYSSCVGGACNATDQAAATAFGVQYCAAAGVTIPVPSATAAPAASSAPAASPAATTHAATTPAASATTSAPAQFTGAANILGYSWIVVGAGAFMALGI